MSPVPEGRVRKHHHSPAKLSKEYEPSEVSQISELASLRVVERKIEEEKKAHEFERDTMWKSCCGLEFDRRVGGFTMKSFMSIVGTFFAMYMIITAEDGDCVCDQQPDDVTMFWGLLTGIIGAYVGPTIEKANK
uniref:Uncharacterized protein n=1 Tax=viral metagenome TaxID=1070528 RepID=A0A6C0BQT7_9ZZZZ